MTYLLLAEKPSAAKNFAKALGGMKGTFNGIPYMIQTLYGHMLEYVEPHEMVDPSEKDLFYAWTPANIPWDISKLNWKKKPQVTTNPATGKTTSKSAAIIDVKKAAANASAIIIATDKDPSGEGQLIGWEVIQTIGWKGDVKRLYFIDESEKELQKGFMNIEDLPHYSKDGEYVKADVRSRWDFISMQLTRLSTHVAREKGYDFVVRQGRLKSVMVKLVADQLSLVQAYEKKPYFEVKYVDESKNVFARIYEDDDTFRFDNKAAATSDLASYSSSTIIVDGTTQKETVPGKLLDLGGLASILGTKGFKAKEVLSTYQKMYEDRLVSYPRTEDTVISMEQFKEMLPLIDQIAGIIGADKSLLTHRMPRKTHVKDGGAHGANRPGLVVPASLDALTSYGPSAKAIYELLAKNFLAMFGENYVYNSIKAHIEKHPAFTSVITVPIDLGFKAIFDADKETSDIQDDENISTGFGTQGIPIVTEGVNKKPQHPTHKWLEKQLSRYEVGTGATRVSTLSEVTNGKTALLTDTRGKLDLTQVGSVSAVLLNGSYIGDPKVTEQLFKSMAAVGTFKMSTKEVLSTATSLILHDKKVFYMNAENLYAAAGKPKTEMAPIVQKEKTTGIYIPLDKEVTFNREWNGYRFSDQEIRQLLTGNTITISGKHPASGTPFTTSGKLGEGSYKGNKFWGFQREEKSSNEYTAKNAPFPMSWSGYTFKQVDEQVLRSGGKLTIQAIGSNKKPYSVDVTFELDTYKGKTSWRIKPHFKSSSASTKSTEEYTRTDAPFRPEFSGYKLTPQDILDVRAGGKILAMPISSKTGKPYTCTLSLELESYQNRKRWVLKPHFTK